MAYGSAGQGDLVIPGYQDFSVLGRGASSTVYRCHDEELNRWVAVKVFLADDPSDPGRRRFRREREITANLGKHPHIVQVLGTGFTESGLPYVVMELYEQGSVADRIQAAGAFSTKDTIDIGAKIADALCAAHEAGVLHRDIKPQNILLSKYGPALADFGIARSVVNLEWSQSLEQLTPWHAAPEILSGEAPTIAADVYALGSSLYTMLAGRPAFAGASGESLLRYQLRATEEPLPAFARTDVPAELFAVLTKAMAKDPGERYQTSAGLRDALLGLNENPARSPETREQSPWAPPASSARVDATGAAPTFFDDPPAFSAPAPPADPSAPTAPGSHTVRRTLPMREQTGASTREPLQVESATALPHGTHPSQEDHGSSQPGPHDAGQAPQAGPLVSPVEASLPLGLAADGSRTIARSQRYSPPDQEPPPNAPGNRWRIPLVAVAAVVLIAAIAVVLITGTRQHGRRVITVPTHRSIPLDTAAAPLALHALVSPASGTSVVLQWTRGATPPDGYVVVEVPGGNATASLVHPGPSASATQFSVGGLNPASSYCFIVIALVGDHAAEAPSCACIRGAVLSPQHEFPNLSCPSG